MRIQKKQNGAALITALFFLIILTMLALTSMNMNIMDEKMASNSQQKNRLFQSAESALVVAMNDENSADTSNTWTNPYTQTAGNLDADMTANFSSTYIAKTPVGRTSTPSDQTFAKYFFEIDVNIENSAGTEKNLTAAMWRIGKNEDGAEPKPISDVIGAGSESS